MSETVAVTIDVSPPAAAALADDATRARIGRLVSRMLARPSLEALTASIAALKADAHGRGLTDDLIDQELAAFNAEQRDPPKPA